MRARQRTWPQLRHDEPAIGAPRRLVTNVGPYAASTSSGSTIRRSAAPANDRCQTPEIRVSRGLPGARRSRRHRASAARSARRRAMWRHPSHSPATGSTSRRRLLCPSSEPTSSTARTARRRTTRPMSNRRREPAAASPEATRRAMSVPRRSSTRSTRNQGTPGIASRPATRPTVPPAIAPLARSAATRAGAVPSHAGASHGGSAGSCGGRCSSGRDRERDRGEHRWGESTPVHPAHRDVDLLGRAGTAAERAGRGGLAVSRASLDRDLSRPGPGTPADRSGTLGGSWPNPRAPQPPQWIAKPV